MGTTFLHVLLSLLALCSYCTPEVPTCPGSIDFAGYGRVELVNAEWNVPGELAGPVEVANDQGRVGVRPGMKGRTYFADACVNGSYDPRRYAAVTLLGKTLNYTVDLSGAGCGCNAALYLDPFRQSTQESSCGDYYCDANSVCGVRCDEIDVQEANMHAWHSTLHVHDDGGGNGAGYGGGVYWNGPRDWTQQEYGPGGECIDTAQPFQVAVSFPVGEQGKLEAMAVELSQAGKPCRLSLEVGRGGYWFGGRDGMAELSETLRAGVTPIISYWSSTDMLWLDGQGPDSLGPCRMDDPSACAASVSFYDFSIQPIAGAVAARAQGGLFLQ